MILVKPVQQRQQDFPVLLHLIESLLDEIMEKMGQAYFTFSPDQALQQAQDLIRAEKYFALLAWESDEVVGFMTAYESYALYAQGAYGTIPECYVVPAYRNQEVGKQLLQAMFKLAEKKQWHRLEVTTPPLPEFEGSLRFYQQNSFEITGGKKLKISLS